MIFPNADVFTAYCISKGYPVQYNDGLRVALATDLSLDPTLFSLADLIRLYESTNGKFYLYP